jgi:hypothetical protein
MEILKDIVYSNFWKATTIILLLVFGCSCGARKVEKSTIKEEIKTEKKIDSTAQKETKTVINDETNEIEITPIDTSKVLIINGKTYKNAKFKISNRKTKTDISAKEKIQLTKNVKSNIVKSNIVKKTEKQYNVFWLFLIPVIAYFYLFYFKK